jgi:hypothetical protein
MKKRRPKTFSDRQNDSRQDDEDNDESCGTEMSCRHITNKMKTATFYGDDKNYSLFNIIITNITTSL